jgi:hypothetical protein
MSDMRRREFISLLGGAAAAWPLMAHAQQRAFPVIGLLSSRSPAVDTPFIAVIRQGLNETGLVEGQNVALDYRWAEGQYDRLAGLAADLVRQQVIRDRQRPGQERPRHQPASPWWQHHGYEHVSYRDGAEAAGRRMRAHRARCRRRARKSASQGTGSSAASTSAPAANVGSGRPVSRRGVVPKYIH